MSKEKHLMEQTLDTTSHAHDRQTVRSFARAFVAGNMATFVVYIFGTVFMLFIGWIPALAYGLYCILSTVAMWRFVCVHCPYYGSVCPCGYSTMAATLFRRGDKRLLPRRHKLIWAFVGPSWLVPPIAGIFLLMQEFSWFIAITLLIFAILAFAVAPSVSRVAGCCEYWRGCPPNWLNNVTRYENKEVVVRK